jgi:hypothetical protein
MQKSECSKGVLIRNKSNQIKPRIHWTKNIIDEGGVVSGVSWDAKIGFKAGDNVREGHARDVSWEGEVAMVAFRGEDKFRFWGPHPTVKSNGGRKSTGDVHW